MTSPTPKSSEYINNERLEYALYILRSRMIPLICDGLRAGERRVLWKAKDLGKNKIKSLTLAGMALSLHPHDVPDDSVNSITGPYRSNVPIFEGHGSFGTLLKPNVYGASRYTSVSLSDFARDVMFCDLDIVPLVDNYDSSEQEPFCFLPLIPTCILNPCSGPVIGFSVNILPRSPIDVIEAQIEYLKTGKVTHPLLPYSLPIDNKASHQEVNQRGECWYFNGEYDTLTQTKIRVTKLPFGITHTEFIAHLTKLESAGTISSYTDSSSNTIDVEVKFPSAQILKTTPKEDVLSMLKLTHREFERLLVIDDKATKLIELTAQEVISKFTDWRLGWYVKRYEHLLAQTKHEYQRFLDIKTAIDNEVNKKAQALKDRKLLIEHLRQLEIVNTDYIADLPIHRFTQAEYEKNEKRIGDAVKLINTYEGLIRSESKRKKAYIEDLTEILTNFKQGKYAASNHE